LSIVRVCSVGYDGVHDFEEKTALFDVAMPVETRNQTLDRQTSTYGGEGPSVGPHVFSARQYRHGDPTMNWNVIGPDTSPIIDGTLPTTSYPADPVTQCSVCKKRAGITLGGSCHQVTSVLENWCHNGQSGATEEEFRQQRAALLVRGREIVRSPGI
jgi:hypothetical protein